MRAIRLFLAISVLSAAWPVGAGTLYKSIAANGTVTFSDVPPESGAKLVEERAVKSAGSGEAVTGPVLGAMAPDNDGELARASLQLDEAEHALAVARRDMWSARDGLRLVGGKRTRAEDDRIAFYKRGVLVARQALLQVVRERQAAAMVPGTPYVASSPYMTAVALR